MSEQVVRGYAIVFNDMEEFLEGEETIIRPDAFMQSVRWPVGLRFGSHKARDLITTANGSLSLFQDDFGLGFEARLPHSLAASRAIRDVESQRVQCSVGFGFIKTKGSGIGGGKTVYSIVAARVDHIALVPDPVFRNTAVWSADVPMAEMPLRLRDLALRWHRGNAAATAYPGGLVRCCPLTPPARPATVTPAKIAATAYEPTPSPPLSVLVMDTGRDGKITYSDYYAPDFRRPWHGIFAY